MNASRLSAIIATLAIGGILAVTWFLGIGPRISEISTANDDRESVEVLNTAHERTLTQLMAIDVPALETDLVDLRLAVPAKAGLADYYREVNSIAQAHGVTITLAGLNGPTRYVGSEAAVENAELAAALGTVSPDNFVLFDADFELTGVNSAVLDAIAAMQTSQRYGLVHNVELPEMAGDLGASIGATVRVQIFMLLSQPMPAEGVAVEVPADAPPAEGDGEAVL